VRDPYGLQTERQGVLQLGQRHGDVVQRQQGHAIEARVLGAEAGHGAVVGVGGGVARLQRALLGKRQRLGEGREHQLFVKAQHIQGLGPLVAVEGAESHIALGPRDQAVAQRLKLGHLGRRQGAALLRRLHQIRQLADGGRGDAGQRRLRLRLGMGDEKVRQFHDMAVGVEEGASGGVGHRRFSRRSGELAARPSLEST